MSMKVLRSMMVCALAVSAAAFAEGGSKPSSDRLVKQVLAPGATLETISSEFEFTEGPLWHPDGYLLFSDLRRSQILKWDPVKGVSVVRDPSQRANGLLLDHKRRLVAAEHESRRVSRTEADGKVVTIADRYDGKRLNSPNDVIEARDGALYFTDPTFGLPQGKVGKELDVSGVYRLAPDGKLTLLVSDFDRPNGLALSPDGKILYVADSTHNHLRAFDVKADGTVANGRVFATLTPWPESEGHPDGLKVDAQGRVFATGAGGVWVLDSSGAVLGVIDTPKATTNVGFGGPDGKTLFITARSDLYRIRLR